MASMLVLTCSWIISCYHWQEKLFFRTWNSWLTLETGLSLRNHWNLWSPCFLGVALSILLILSCQHMISQRLLWNAWEGKHFTIHLEIFIELSCILWHAQGHIRYVVRAVCSWCELGKKARESLLERKRFSPWKTESSETFSWTSGSDQRISYKLFLFSGGGRTIWTKGKPCFFLQVLRRKFPPIKKLQAWYNTTCTSV